MAGSRRQGAKRRWEALLARPLLLPPSAFLTLSLRRLARAHPEAFVRLGEHAQRIYLIAPTDLPLAFCLRPAGTEGAIRLVAAGDAPEAAVRIRGALLDLLQLFDGTMDADAAFFSRRIQVEGDTSALVALHNALEAADLTLADLIGAPRPTRDLVNRGLSWTTQRWRSA
ncbi:ubiquinone anaerobic biosynthesis accessory factor UbiT [Caulobacter sp. RL271]|jgi:predicted lipid carrier protein YhbT|uniref:SCP2 sterol-binding domain-containing protein n=1 Tax=Caulobacter segnis TaxID=88688 RepID=A0ABY4ZPA7_9CAUL|nr:SCP2 sterol-binding domain-containing protein [Caulobacter segnis]USQ94459.1 SCP2 sterol-binding domain-containing protein [Caulobacter segnis]